MRRLREAVIRCARLAGPLCVVGLVFGVGVLGVHAIWDWHHHGELGSGIFHLHFHVGEHEHDHPADDHDHDHSSPADDAGDRPAVVTFAQALGPGATTTPAVASPNFNIDRPAVKDVSVLPPADLRASANPRAPPA